MTQTNKILIAVVATAAALAGFWFLALAPKREKAAALQTQISQKQGDLQSAQATVASYRKAKGDYKSNYATVVRLGKAVPEDDDVRSMLVQLDAAAGGSNVDFRSIQVGGGAAATVDPALTAGADAPPPGAVSVGAAGFSAMPFTFSFKGSFANLSSFFSQMERFVTLRNEKLNVTGRLLRLESLDLQVDQSGFPQIRAQIGASSYLVPAAQGLSAGGTPQGPTVAAPAQTASTGGPAATTTTATVTGATP